MLPTRGHRSRANPVEIPFKVYDDLGRDDIWDHEGSVQVR
jgi:hypothetical protein